jgi:hypothetical protein
MRNFGQVSNALWEIWRNEHFTLTDYMERVRRSRQEETQIILNGTWGTGN